MFRVGVFCLPAPHPGCEILGPSGPAGGRSPLRRFAPNQRKLADWHQGSWRNLTDYHQASWCDADRLGMVRAAGEPACGVEAEGADGQRPPASTPPLMRRAKRRGCDAQTKNSWTFEMRLEVIRDKSMEFGPVAMLLTTLAWSFVWETHSLSSF